MGPFIHGTKVGVWFHMHKHIGNANVNSSESSQQARLEDKTTPDSPSIEL